MPTPPAAQGAPSWSSSSGGATSSPSASTSCSSDPSSSSHSPSSPVPTSSSGPSSSPPHVAPSSDDNRGLLDHRRRRAPSSPLPSCAACRHQRRRCSPNCPLRPYLVEDEPDKFQNALRMFGVKNLRRILRVVPPPRRDVCVQTIIYESNVRAADPVRGCCGVIQDLENQLMDTAVELEVLRRRLESYRQMDRVSQSHQPPNPLPIQQQLMARTSDNPQYGVPPAANELTATQPHLSAMDMEPPLSQVQPLMKPS